MSCCEPLIVPFSSVAISDVNYSGLVDINGAYPDVRVFYYDPSTGDYYESKFFTELTFNPLTKIIHIDHAGVASGIVKVS